MTRPSHTRYTLRLSSPAAAAAVNAATSAQPEDDWSGAAAYVSVPSPYPLDYRDPRAVEVVLALQPAGWQEEDDGETLIFWLDEDAAMQPEVARALRRLGEFGHLEVAREKPGWEDAWRRFHKPHAVGRLYLRPPWYPPRGDLLDVVVEAGQAFGTGGHPSTRQCLEELQRIAPGPLLDLGCGTGVVSLAALRLGFAPVWGVDIDPRAVNAAAGNAARNGLGPTFLLGDATDPAYGLPDAPVVVANLALNPIVRLARRCARGVAGELLPRDLLLAGLLVDQRAEAVAAFPEYEVEAQIEEERWLLLHLRRRP